MKKKRTRRNSFEFNSILLFVLMMMANVCNYLFQIIIARLLGDVEKYGIINTLVSFQAICNIPAMLLIMVTARYVALYNESDSKETMTNILLFLRKSAGFIGVFMIVIGGALTPYIAQGLQLEDKKFVFMVVIASVLLLLSSVNVGCLQGIQDFIKYGMQNLINILAKLLFGIVFVLIGWEVMGVLGALILGSVLVYVYAYMYTRKYFFSEKRINIEKETTTEIKKYILGIFCFQTCINLLTNGDMLLVKYFFDGAQAGIYSSAMVIGKIATYVSGAIVGTLFPMAAMQHSQGGDTRGLLKKALMYGGGASIICAVGMIVSGKFVISLLFGGPYFSAVNYLPAICLYVVPLTFLSVIANFLAAIGKTRLVSWSLVFGCIGAIMISICFHRNITQMMSGVGAILTFVFIYDLFVYLRENNKSGGENK